MARFCVKTRTIKASLVNEHKTPNYTKGGKFKGGRKLEGLNVRLSILFFVPIFKFKSITLIRGAR